MTRIQTKVPKNPLSPSRVNFTTQIDRKLRALAKEEGRQIQEITEEAPEISLKTGVRGKCGLRWCAPIGRVTLGLARSTRNWHLESRYGRCSGPCEKPLIHPI